MINEPTQQASALGDVPEADRGAARRSDRMSNVFVQRLVIVAVVCLTLVVTAILSTTPLGSARIHLNLIVGEVGVAIPVGGVIDLGVFRLKGLVVNNPEGFVLERPEMQPIAATTVEIPYTTDETTGKDSAASAALDRCGATNGAFDTSLSAMQLSQGGAVRFSYDREGQRLRLQLTSSADEVVITPNLTGKVGVIPFNEDDEEQAEQSLLLEGAAKLSASRRLTLLLTLHSDVDCIVCDALNISALDVNAAKELNVGTAWYAHDYSTIRSGELTFEGVPQRKVDLRTGERLELRLTRAVLLRLAQVGSGEFVLGLAGEASSINGGFPGAPRNLMPSKLDLLAANDNQRIWTITAALCGLVIALLSRWGGWKV